MDKICQSCGMPLENEELLGTNADGSKNEEYCIYCYENGAFTKDMTMEDMINFCADHAEEWEMNITKDDAIKMMQENFPKLKRWAPKE